MEPLKASAARAPASSRWPDPDSTMKCTFKTKRFREFPDACNTLPAMPGKVNRFIVSARRIFCRLVFENNVKWAWGGTSLCLVYGYVPLTSVYSSLPKLQNRPQILKFYSRTGPTFWSFTPEQDRFLTIWSQTLGLNVKIPVAFSFCFLQPDVFTFVTLYLSKCFKLSITGISLSQDICIPLWI